MDNSHIWKRFLADYLSGKVKRTPYAFWFEKLFRARKCENIESAISYYHHVKKIWNPKPSKSKQGRCNFKGQSILYLASGIRSLPYELSCQKGDVLCVGHFVQKTTKERLGPYSIIGAKFLIESELLYPVIQKYFSSYTELEKSIDKKLANIFSAQKHGEQGFNFYNITSALTNIYLHKSSGPFGRNEGNSDSVGLIYPCVMKKFNSFNIVIRPTYAKKHFFVEKLELLKFVDEDSKGGSLFNLIAKGRVDTCGNIKWSEKKERAPSLYIE